jgi:hypothetical protein
MREDFLQRRHLVAEIVLLEILQMVNLLALMIGNRPVGLFPVKGSPLISPK